MWKKWIGMLGVSKVVIPYVTKKGERKEYKYWKARIHIRGRNVYLGQFKKRSDAASAYRTASRER